MRSDGILGNRNNQVVGAKAATSRRTKWLKRRERWLVVLGIVLHAVYMLSIFDIYFKSPIVHGVDPVPPRFTAPAKRLVLLVGTLKLKTKNAQHLFHIMFILLFSFSGQVVVEMSIEQRLVLPSQLVHLN